MKRIRGKNVLLTGATGGIGSEVAQLLLENNCQLGLVGRSEPKLQQLNERFSRYQKQFITVQADINNTVERQLCLRHTREYFGNLDILINLAGTMDFNSFYRQDEETIEKIFHTNTLAPIKLCRDVLPSMLAANNGHIVNVGSIFGSIAFAYFTTYSASKFALRGFSEALRRELADTPIKISYIAPRAVKTSLNSKAVYAMAKEVNMTLDSPKLVAQQIVSAIANDRKDVFLGFPEALFVRINALLPRLVDFGTRNQNRVAQKYLNQ